MFYLHILALNENEIKRCDVNTRRLLTCMSAWAPCLNADVAMQL